MESHRVCPLATGVFHSARCPQGASVRSRFFPLFRADWYPAVRTLHVWPACHPSGGGRSGCCSPRGVVKMLLGACGAQTPSRPCFQLLAICTQRCVAGSHADATCKFFRNCQTVFQYFFLSHLDRGARRRDGGSFLAHGGVLGGQKPAHRGVCPPDCPSGYSPCFSFAWKLTQPGAISEAGVSILFSLNSGVHHVEAWGCGPLHLLDTQARENWRDYVPQFPHP